MSRKGCNLYYSFPLIFGTNFRYEPNYVQGHNNIEELVYDILQASISTRLGYISYVYITISRSLRYNVLHVIRENAVIDMIYCHVMYRLICSNFNHSIYI